MFIYKYNYNIYCLIFLPYPYLNSIPSRVQIISQAVLYSSTISPSWSVYFTGASGLTKCL